MQQEKKEKVLKNIGANIQNIRKEKGKERKEIADQLGLTVQGYGNIENGKTDLSISHAIDLAAVLGTNYQQILNIENNKIYNQTASVNGGGNGILNAETMNLDDNKKLILQLEKDLDLVRADMEKRLADKDKIIALLEKKK